MKADDNDLSQSLAGVAAEQWKELSKLSGAAFDKAYAENEVAYYVTVIGALETTLISVHKERRAQELAGNPPERPSKACRAKL